MSAPSKAILDVGQCAPDHAAITRAIKHRFKVEVEYCGTIQAALEELSGRRYELVLVNRIIDGTHEEGVELVRRMKASPFLKDVPVMLVSNFASAQREAVQAGAVPGFGKARLDEADTLDALSTYLA